MRLVFQISDKVSLESTLVVQWGQSFSSVKHYRAQETKIRAWQWTSIHRERRPTGLWIGGNSATVGIVNRCNFELGACRQSNSNSNQPMVEQKTTTTSVSFLRVR